jgi:hypothetical protein
MMSGGVLAELDISRSCDREIIKAFYQAGSNAMNFGKFVGVFDRTHEDQQLSRSVHRTSAMERHTSCSGWSDRSSV